MTQNKTDKLKELLLKQIEKTPIIETACQLCGIHRSTFYRWKLSDDDFAEKADKAFIESRELISDLAESQLISHIKDKNLRACIYWLEKHKDIYAQKLKVEGNLTTKHEYALTNNQKDEIEKVIKLLKLNPEKETYENK